MANIVGDIAIKVGADISPLVRDMGRANAEVAGLGGKLGGLSKGLGAATAGGAALAGAVLGAGTALAALTRASMDNIDSLSKQARAVGISVASFQAMALVAEEAGVESDKFGKLLIKMQDNIASLNAGTAAQVQQFQALGLSISSLAGLGADEQFRLIAERMSAISEPSERTAAALNIFGKAGADAITMLDGYGAAVDNAAAFQRQFGIAVSDTDAQNIEAANDAMGRLGIAVTGVGNVLAAEFAPAMTAAAEGLLAFIENTFSAEAAMESLVGSLDEAKALLGEDVYAALITSAGAVNENAGAIRDLAYEYDALEAQIEATGRAVDGTIYDLGDSPIAQQLADILSLMESLQIEAVQGTKSYEVMTAEMNAAAAEAVRLLEQASAINGLDVSFAVQAFNTLTRAIGVTVGAAKDLRAAMPGGTPAPGPTTDDRGLAIADRRAGMLGDFAPATSPRPEQQPFELGVPDPERGGGGGGGGGDSFASEMERLREQLMTAEQIEMDSYARRQAMLQDAADQKVITQEEYAKMMESAQAQHQDRMTGIDVYRYGTGLEQAGQFFGDMASAMQGGNEKMIKMARAFGAASALINAWLGFSQAIADPTLPFFAKFAAAASVLSAGMGAVNAIKGGSNASGAAVSGAAGGGSAIGGAARAASAMTSSSSAGGGSAAAAAPDQSQIVNISLTGDSIGRDGMASLFDQINKGLAKGYRIERVNFT